MKKKKANNGRTSGKSSKKVVRRSYTPISDALAQPQVFADTELADGINKHGLVNLFARCFRKQRRSDAEPIAGILCALIVWPLLKVSSIHCFCAELCQFLTGRKDDSQRRQDILYGVMGREDINWRNMSGKVSMNAASETDLGSVNQRAFVVDDSIKPRRGEKVEGSSRHWDHTEGRSVFGQQVVELGIAGEKGFLPIDRQIYMGSKGAVEKPLDKDFRDKRSAAARDMERALTEDKHGMFRRMLNGAIRKGHRAKYVIADAWFGCKENIEAALACGLTAIFQMKRGNLKYRLHKDGKRAYTAKELYTKCQRRLKQENKRSIYKTHRMKAWINLETDPAKEERWHEIILVFSAPANNSGNESWVVFLCTDVDATAGQVLSVYALRWSIEVYFKEVKQNFGFLAEQSGRYQFSYASVHLAAIRYTLLFEAMVRSGGLSYGEVRDKQSGQLQVLSYAGLMWQLFRTIIEGAMDGLVETLGSDVVERVSQEIDEAIESFLTRALQLEPNLIQSQLRAEAAGHL